MKEIFTEDSYKPNYDTKLFFILLLVIITIFTTVRYSSLHMNYNKVIAQMKQREVHDIKTYRYINELKANLYNLSHECTNFMSDDEVVNFMDFMDEKKTKLEQNEGQLQHNHNQPKPKIKEIILKQNDGWTVASIGDNNG